MSSNKESRIRIAKHDIQKTFDNSRSSIFTKTELSQILSENHEFWRLRQGETTNSFIRFLIEESKLKEHRFKFPYRTETRYTWGDPPLYELLLSTQANSYFSHYTAVYFHELTEQVPKTIYINKEQNKGSNSTGTLTQESIDIAFKNHQRQSSNTIEYEGYKVCVLNGKNTGRLGVISTNGPDESRIEVTDLERTLIDAVVRPAYAGGVHEVLKAFRNAHSRISANRLSAYLKKINYTYPYHQSIGFYLERTGVYSASQLDLFYREGMEYDFYLTHSMKEKEYDKKWKLFYPKRF